MKKTYEQLKWEMAIIDEFIEKAYEGLVIIDESGNIVKFKYEKLLDIKEEEALGKHITEVIENTRLHLVLESGEPELGDIQLIKGHRVVTSRIPIMRDGKAIGAVGTILFKDVAEVKYMAEHLEQMKAYVKQFNKDIKRMHTAKYRFESILTNDKNMDYVMGLAKKASQSDVSVYIEGESGTGKEYFAHAIHEASHRHYGPFVRVNCAGIPETLIESELFGYEPGAFTGASTHGKVGKFELANGGTIFLDEIGVMPLEMQTKLLRVLEEREIERIGGNSRIPLDIRVIVATNESLLELTTNGLFRKDLYYRINVVHIELPPLRERPRDIELLAQHFLKVYTAKARKNITHITKDAMESMLIYQWPGNIRELRNVIEGAVALNETGVIGYQDLPELMYEKKRQTPLMQKSLKKQIAEIERKILLDTIERCGGNKALAAQVLGIHRTALYKKLERDKSL